MHPHNSFLLETLLEHRWISEAQASEAHHDVSDSLRGDEREAALLRSVTKASGIAESEFLGFLAQSEGIACAGISDVPSSADVLELSGVLKAEDAKKYRVVPVRCTNSLVTLIGTYPCSYESLEIIAHLIDRDVEFLLTTHSQWEDVFELLFPATRSSFSSNRTPTLGVAATEQVINSVRSRLEPISFGEGSSVDDENGQISRYVEWVVAEAIHRRASDIHFEPMERTFRIRCRVDGVLQQLDSPPKSQQASILSRIKLISQLDIAEKRLPQDGRFHLSLNGKNFDFRVSTVPSTHGEAIVVRILDKERLNIGLPELGMLENVRVKFERIVSSPDGIFLVTGPTGSGKSTTLYSALNFINDPNVKIITVEDPVEYHIEGINQTQVRREVNMTFSAALRAMLRQAPNIIMVGEIRDKETAEIAINASLTGHTVFSTLHTNDAPSAITRLIDMGAKPFLVAAALRAVMAQRLVRKIPESHRIGYEIAEWQLKALGEDYDDLRGQIVFHAGHDHQSYKGRVGVFEMFEVDESLGELIYRNPVLSAIRQQLKEKGFRNLRYDGIQKALMGWTSIEEVLAVTPFDEVGFVP